MLYPDPRRGGTKMNKVLSFEENLIIFGRDEVRDILADKVIEEAHTNKTLHQKYSEIKSSMEKNLTGIGQYIGLKYLELSSGDKITKSDKDLKRYSVQYLKTVNKLHKPKEGLTDYQIQTAREHPVEDLIGGKVRVTGSRKTTSCPFHQEKTPSFVVYSDNSFHCFGCGANGSNAIDFVMKRDQASFKDAVRSLA